MAAFKQTTGSVCVCVWLSGIIARFPGECMSSWRFRPQRSKVDELKHRHVLVVMTRDGHFHLCFTPEDVCSYFSSPLIFYLLVFSESCGCEVLELKDQTGTFVWTSHCTTGWRILICCSSVFREVFSTKMLNSWLCRQKLRLIKGITSLRIYVFFPSATSTFCIL